jgi:hypothetical protein
MPVVSETGFTMNLSHRGTGFATGPTRTFVHNVIPGFFSIHTGLSLIQATTGGPLGAAVGIMKFGAQDFGPNPNQWRNTVYGTVGTWTFAGQVTKGDLSGWEFIQVWQ